MQRPNLLYVFPDQFRQMAMGFWNDPDFQDCLPGEPDPVHTPNLDKFSKEALVLTNAVSNYPLCSPHRGSLFTGMYPNRSGVPLNCNSDRLNSDLPKSATCLTDVLAQSGYSVGYIGKWHLDFPTANDPENPGGFVDPNTPAWDSYTEPTRRHGIDYWYGYGTFDQHKNPHYYDNDGKRTEPKEWSAKHEADKAIAYLNNSDNQRDPNQPFALFVSMNPPHSPYQSLDDCMQEDLALYQDKSLEQLLVRENADLNCDKAASAPYYFANVTGVDREFGRILKALKETGEWENTLVVFTSDHGETLCAHGLDDAKNAIYNEAFNVPFLMKLPFQIRSAISHRFMSSPDIMPTVLGLLGLSENTPQHIQGINIAPEIIANKDKSGCALYIKNLDGERDDQGKIVSYFPVSRGIKTKRYSLVLTINRQRELDSVLLFDNQTDPYQLQSLDFNPTHSVEQALLLQLASELNRISDPWAEQQILADLIPYDTECKQEKQ
ncbi:sulfatase [Vibrio sp. SCSIO 43132]|uniref:sulfatase family protein n=1 Tax=Vibrio sp. SCSIO 43132 TaxID=2779363 RepID=UPI001CA7EA5D|nr:sulfatase [Vibrio sp. SCSIO 43132]UAB73863.1 sulfatase [Vibrio sp. SCSIO 43132]